MKFFLRSYTYFTMRNEKLSLAGELIHFYKTPRRMFHFVTRFDNYSFKRKKIKDIIDISIHKRMHADTVHALVKHSYK